MNFFKFFKFSKLLSACVSFGILFSGFKADGMNLKMLGIGIRNNSDDDSASVATRYSQTSLIQNIKPKFPERCKFCNQKVSRCVMFSQCSSREFICENNDCLQKCYNDFLSLSSLESRNLDTDIHRCESFKNNMSKLHNWLHKPLQRFDTSFTNKLNRWNRYREDKFLDTLFLHCGHSTCFCSACSGKLKEAYASDKCEIVCPKCQTKFDLTKGGMLILSIQDSNCQCVNKWLQLLDQKLNGDWNNHVICFSNNKNIDIVGSLHVCFCSDLNDEFDEEKFDGVDREIRFKKKILVLDCDFNKGNMKLSLPPKSELYNYINLSTKDGKYIVYPVKGELRDEIIKFIRNEVHNKMQGDNVE